MRRFSEHLIPLKLLPKRGNPSVGVGTYVGTGALACAGEQGSPRRTGVGTYVGTGALACAGEQGSPRRHPVRSLQLTPQHLTALKSAPERQLSSTIAADK
ncbi:MAG TPA: hypothetical protein VFA76_05245 [Terriglobales bacterium]|nr:hypothetical protein [Terriglobales bacterium]